MDHHGGIWWIEITSGKRKYGFSLKTKPKVTIWHFWIVQQITKEPAWAGAHLGGRSLVGRGPLLYYFMKYILGRPTLKIF